MNPLHQFAIALVVLLIGWLIFLALVRQIAGRRWANIIEAIRGVLFWTVLWLLFSVYAYLLQATTLSKLTRSEIVGFGEPWLSFIHQTTHLTTPYIMAFLLMVFAAAGGFLVATNLDILLGLLGLSSQWANLTGEQRAGFVQNLVSSIAFIIMGLVMVWPDALVFALRWAMDVGEVEKELQGASSIASLICRGYFLGFIALSWIVHRKYRQFLIAARIEEPETEQNAQAPSRISQQTPSLPSETALSEIERSQTPTERMNQRMWQTVLQGGNGSEQRPTYGGQFPDIPVITTDQSPQDGAEETVLPEHFDPFRTRRR